MSQGLELTVTLSRHSPGVETRVPFQIERFLGLWSLDANQGISWSGPILN